MPEKTIGHKEYKGRCFTSQCYTPKKNQQQLMKKMKKNSICNLIWAGPVMQNSPAAKQQPDLQLYFGINNSFFSQLDLVPALMWSQQLWQNISDLNGYMQ